jgi:23S rRNA (guanosine2251-2'-O)-methyltransferase
MLDGVTDPRNLGAVLRVADGAGARGVIVAKRRAVGGAGWSAVAKTSSGALASMPLVSVANLTQCLKTLKKMGFWVVGAGFGATAKPYHTLDYRQPTVLVLGSEGEGLSRLVSEQCDWLATLPMRGMVASLNVATAAAVLAYEATRQQFLPAGGTTTAGAAP